MAQPHQQATRDGSMNSVFHSSGYLEVELQPGLVVCHTTAKCLGAVEEPGAFSGDHEFLHFNCQLSGKFDGWVGKHVLAYNQGDVTLGYSAGERFHIRHSRDFQNLSVMVTPTVLQELAGEEVCRIVGLEFVQMDQGREPGFFVRGAGQCRKTMRSAMSIANLIQGGPEHRLLLHSATLDFLHWHLASFRTCRGCDALSPRDCRQLENARQLLLKDLSAPPTIAELARAVGMNQCKLKSCFKKRFGTTIYALFQEERMKHARLLLRHHNVTETAMILGYSNISHFSSAFLKQFGCLPSKARQFSVDVLEVEVADE